MCTKRKGFDKTMNSEKAQKVYKIIMLIIITALVSSLITAVVVTERLTSSSSIESIANGDGTTGIETTLAYIRTLLEKDYIGELDDEQMIEMAIKGYVAGVGDEYTVYYTPEEMNSEYDEAMGNYVGIGIYMIVNYEKGTIEVVEPMDNSPALEAGLQKGDMIISVNGKDLTADNVKELSNEIKGEEGTTVKLGIKRGEETFEVDVERKRIEVSHIESKMLDNNIGYIQIVSFSEDTANEFNEAYNDLKNQGMKALVLDLRNNPGGLLTTCVEIAKKLVPKGEIVSIVDKQGNKETYSSSLEAPEYPLVVLINKNSASASEILSGAIQDTKAGTIIGNTSYGKGSVQTILPMFEDDAVKLTIAKYYTPSGRSIDGTGITPDIEINLDENATSDTQLDKALEVLKAQLNNN